MKQRLPIVLSVTAFVLAVLGLSPLGQAAGRVVRRALYAKNAGAVSGIKASRTPAAGKLLPLGSNGKFPASVGAIGPQGPAGPTGSTGPQGPQGPVGTPDTSNFYTKAEADSRYVVAAGSGANTRASSLFAAAGGSNSQYVGNIGKVTLSCGGLAQASLSFMNNRSDVLENVWTERLRPGGVNNTITWEVVNPGVSTTPFTTDNAEHATYYVSVGGSVALASQINVWVATDVAHFSCLAVMQWLTVPRG